VEVVAQLVPSGSEECDPLRFRTLERRWIVEVFVNHDGLAGKEWAAFLGVVTEGQNIVERLAGEFVHALGAMARNVDAQFAHNGDRFGSNMARLGPGAEYLETVSCVVTQKAFGHLAPGCISRAEDEDSLLIGHGYFPVECAGRQLLLRSLEVKEQAIERDPWLRARPLIGQR
jgi:hypothetical protein